MQADSGVFFLWNNKGTDAGGLGCVFLWNNKGTDAG